MKVFKFNYWALASIIWFVWVFAALVKDIGSISEPDEFKVTDCILVIFVLLSIYYAGYKSKFNKDID